MNRSSSRKLASRRPNKRELLLPPTLNADTRGGSGHEASTVTRTAIAAGGRKGKERCSLISRLESFPAELLEMIFLYSQNVNLPRASPFLAGSLSTERIYRLLILLAFWDDSGLDRKIMEKPMSNNGWDLNKNNDAIFRILRPLGSEYRRLSPNERGSLQSAILRCRWCSVERIQSQLPALQELIIRRQWISHIHPKMEYGERVALEEYLDSGIDVDERGIRSFRGIGLRTTQRAVKQEQEQERDASFWTWELSILPGIWVRTFIYGREDVPPIFSEYPLLSVKEFPSFLLRGEGDDHDHGRNKPKPLSERQMAHIETFCMAGGLIYERLISAPRLMTGLDKVSISRKELQKGIRTAIVNNNPRTLSILLLLDESVIRSRKGFYGTRTQYTIPARHFRAAVRTCRSRRKDRQSALPTDLLRILICANSESLPSDDELVKQFAKEAGGVFGEWLLDLMMDEGNRRYGLFYMGETCMDIPLARRYVEEVRNDQDDCYSRFRDLESSPLSSPW